MNTKDIEARIRKLPDDLIPEVMDYIDFLMTRHRNKRNGKKKFTFDWEGGLSHLKDDYSSVELQHKVSEWR